MDGNTRRRTLHHLPHFTYPEFRVSDLHTAPQPLEVGEIGTLAIVDVAVARLVAGLLGYQFGAPFAALTVGTIVTYATFTLL